MLEVTLASSWTPLFFEVEELILPLSGDLSDPIPDIMEAEGFGDGFPAGFFEGSVLTVLVCFVKGGLLGRFFFALPPLSGGPIERFFEGLFLALASWSEGGGVDLSCIKIAELLSLGDGPGISLAIFWGVGLSLISLADFIFLFF